MCLHRDLADPELSTDLLVQQPGDNAIRTRVLADGAVECLFKPFSEAALVDALNAALRMR